METLEIIGLAGYGAIIAMVSARFVLALQRQRRGERAAPPRSHR